MIERRKLLAPLFFGAAIIFGVPMTSGSHSESPESEPFPMREGTTWIYRGIVRWYDAQAHKEASSVVSLKSEIVRVFRGQSFVAALLRGFPADLDWSDGRADTREYLAVQAGEEFHILTDKAKFPEIVRALEDPSSSVRSFFGDDDLFVRFPLNKGMKFCDAEAMKRTDDHYCWVVATSRETALKDVKGIRNRNYSSFLIQYVTNPDDTELEFVPGIGFTSYRYHHHGTVADTELHLIEYHEAKAAQTVTGETR